ncbi:ATP-grasp domain-containing protein [Bacillus sp. S10(2024)]|uniref:ATP-grasp domain-containing protein n=1 Tax=Bacillus sp. S10(2024) TaxID=3162886 RepID=UPI003D249724
MSVLIINNFSRARYSEMLPEIKNQLVVLSYCDLEDSDEFLYFERISYSQLSSYVVIRALELYERYQFESVIADDEYDLINAGLIREKLNIKGQTVESAIAFRDKVVMKDYLSKKLNVPPYRRLHSVKDLYEFIEQYSYPVIIKPIDQGASRGIYVLYNNEDLKDFSKISWETNWEVEKFVEGEMYHIDALVEDGNIVTLSVSKYLNGCLAFQDNQNLGSYQLHPNELMFDRLRELFKEVLENLPHPPVSVYHLEVFHTNKDEFFVCEIASRIGGGLISNLVLETYGIDLGVYWFRSICNLPNNEGEKEYIDTVKGFMYIPPRYGTLKSVPKDVDFPFVTSYKVVAKPLQKYDKASRSIDRICEVVIEGTDSKDLENKLIQLSEWFADQIKWDIESNIETERAVL